MKENGINKLIELLNESEDGFVSKFVSYDDINGVFRLDNGQSFHYTLILSKEYCFIKRLVENDKIDESKIFCDQGLYYSLLCKLAISDTPIEDLISYLR